MALNMRKIDRKRTRADEMLKQVELTPSADHSNSNSTQSTIDSLDSMESSFSQDTAESQTVDLDTKGKSDQGLGLNQDGTYKQSRAGRKKKSTQEKKTQIVLTLDPTVASRLKAWAESKPRSATNYLSMFVEDHLEDILSQIDKK